MAKQMLNTFNINAANAYEAYVIQLCQKLNLHVQFGDNILCANNGFSRWMLIMQDEYTVKKALH